MAKVETIALIEKRPDISRSLFTRYWRDVHGVMAARIPGFDSYTQHHVSSYSELKYNFEPFEGIAVVSFKNEADRAGLVESKITSFIHRDEQNVFRRALLYNLPKSAEVYIGNEEAIGTILVYFVLPQSTNVDELISNIQTSSVKSLKKYDLTGGDPSAWNETDASDGQKGRLFTTLLETRWKDKEDLKTAIKKNPQISADRVGIYIVDDTYKMVEQGFPTHIGLRGLDAVKTIEEAKAENQLERNVVKEIYQIK